MGYQPIAIQAFEPTVRAQPWGEEVTIARTDAYTGKILRYRAGEAGGMQYHVEKVETFHLFAGAAVVVHADEDDMLHVAYMAEGETFHIPAGAVHQFRALTDCVVFEVSTPVDDDRVRMEAHYGIRPVEGAGPTTWDISGETPVRIVGDGIAAG